MNDQAGDGQRLAGLHFDGRVGRPLSGSRAVPVTVSRKLGSISVMSGRTSRRISAVAQHDRDEVDPRAELAIL